MSKTSEGEKILKKLRDAGKKMTADDFRKQKVSFVKGMMSFDTEVDEKEIEAAVDNYPG